jgi:methanogenic corrinoid protein MtbC1
MTNQRIAAGEDPMKILDDTREGMGIVGKRFAAGEYFLPRAGVFGRDAEIGDGHRETAAESGDGAKEEKYGRWSSAQWPEIFMTWPEHC